MSVRAYCLWCSHIILTWLSLFWCSPILIIKPCMHLCYFILSVVYFYSERPPLSKYFILCVVYFYSERPPLLQRSEARDFGGVSQIYIYIYIFFFFFKEKTLQSSALVYHKNGPWFTLPLLQWYLKTLGIIVLNIANFETFCDVRCTNELVDLWWMNGELWVLYYCLWQTACHVFLLIYV